MDFGDGCSNGVLSFRIGSSSIALVCTDLAVFLGISNPGIKLAHLHLDGLQIFVSPQLF